MKDFMKTITSAIKCWTTAKIKNSTADWNEKDVNKDSYIKNKPDVALRKEVDAIQNAIDYKMNNSNPVGTGSFSMNRLPNSEIGDYSHAEGYSTEASGYSSHAEGSDTVASGVDSHAEGSDTVATGGASHAEGYYAKASGNSSHAEGYSTEASGNQSHAEGYHTKASDYSHAEGNHTIASGKSSHAEGNYTEASVDYSHAEGYYTEASGHSSHAEGNYTEASGASSHAEGYHTKASDYSHAEGYYTEASAYSSHAEGDHTKASGDYQHVQGKYNIDDVDADGNPLNNYAHIVGNGVNRVSYNKRSNAHTLDWEGNAWFSGDVYTGSTSGTNRDEGSKKLASEEYVDNAVANAGGGVQSDWNQNDETTSDYVKNRPFYTENEGEITEIVPETTFTIDNEGMWYSEKFAIPIEAGNTYICKYNGVEYICTAFSYAQDGIEGIFLGNMGKTGADFEDTGEPFVIVTVPADNMTMVILHDGTVSTNITCSITMNNEVIHKLPNKYLDLDWKPTKEYKLTDVFPINNLTFTGKEITLIDSQVFYLHVGEEYTVNWNGTEYVCEAKRIDADPFSVFYIGNSGLTSLTGKVDTGEPFIYWYLTNATNSVIAFAKLTKEDTTTETVSISVKGYTDVYNKIPTNFLPDSYVIPTDIDAGLVINELRLADKAFQEGRRVYARKGGVFGQVIYLNFDSVDSIFNQMWFVSDSKMFYIWSYEYGSTNGVAKTNYIVVGLVPDISGTRGYSVPVPSEMKAGQMVRLKSIDESKASGYNMAWEAVDPWVIESSTAGSTKKFKLTVDDSGTISTTEVTE